MAPRHILRKRRLTEMLHLMGLDATRFDGTAIYWKWLCRNCWPTRVLLFRWATRFQSWVDKGCLRS